MTPGERDTKMDARITIRSDRRWRYLWLKSVIGVELTKHCAASLRGTYAKGLGTEPGLYTADLPFDQLLDGELSPHAYYLCGVSAPYRWNENAHVVFEPEEGTTGRIHQLGLMIDFVGVRPMAVFEPSAEQLLAAGVVSVPDKAFTTCRNWQYAVGIAASGRL